MQTVSIKGAGLSGFLDFLEDEQQEGRFKAIDHKEVVSTGDESTGDAEILSIILTGAVSVISSLLVTYLSRGKQNEITFEVENNGKKLSVTIKDMTIDEVRHAMRDFLEN